MHKAFRKTVRSNTRHFFLFLGPIISEEKKKLKLPWKAYVALTGHWSVKLHRPFLSLVPFRLACSMYYYNGYDAASELQYGKCFLH